MMVMVDSDPNSQEIIFVANTFFEVSFLCVFEKNNSGFRGENKR